jgi:hypothetical protein
MYQRTFFVRLLAAIWVLTSCVPSEASIATAIANTMTAQPTETLVSSLTPTETPSPSLTPTNTVTPQPTMTPEPTLTKTPIPLGSFENPAKLGDRVIAVSSPVPMFQFAVTVIEVKRGQEASTLARNKLGLLYSKPIEGQEYIAIKLKIEVIQTSSTNEVYSLIPYSDFTLRYEKDGDDFWSEDIAGWKDAYPPYDAEGWMYFLIRENTNPYLYCQPVLYGSAPHGYRSSGMYFDLSATNEN